MEQMLIGMFAGSSGYDLLLLVSLGLMGLYAVYGELKLRGFKMGKYSKFKSDIYNGCGYLFLLVVLAESLGLLIGRGDGGEALLSNSPIAGAIVNILLAFVHILALVGSLNIADRLNKAIKPV